MPELVGYCLAVLVQMFRQAVYPLHHRVYLEDPLVPSAFFRVGDIRRPAAYQGGQQHEAEQDHPVEVWGNWRRPLERREVRFPAWVVPALGCFVPVAFLRTTPTG